LEEVGFKEGVHGKVFQDQSWPILRHVICRGSVVECGGRDARAPCIGDTAIERGKNALRPKYTVRHATAVSRQGLPPHSTTLPRHAMQ
jgi:hypothetical protein